jgi:hypothetical protein
LRGHHHRLRLSVGRRDRRVLRNSLHHNRSRRPSERWRRGYGGRRSGDDV